MMSIFSPRSSRMIDCTRMPFMPTQAPTLSTSRSRLETAILVRSPASRAQPRMLYGAVVNFGDFLFEQALDQLGIGARDHHAGAFGGLVDDLDDAADAVADAVAFEARLLALGQAGFGLAEIEHVDPSPSTRLMVELTSSPTRSEYS